MSKALILLAHGSRDPAWAAPFQMLTETLQAKHPQSQIALAFMELTEPSLTEVLKTWDQEGHTEVEVLPVFFAAGRHLKKDVPAQIEAFCEESSMKVTLREPIGAWPEIQAVMTDAIGTKLELG